MTSGIMLQLGGFQFSVDTAAHEKLKRISTYRWRSQERIGQRPQKQNLGIGEDVISLDGTIFPGYTRGGVAVGLYQVEHLRAQAEAMQPLVLTDGMGQVYGLWGIDTIEEGQSVFFDDGSFRKQEFSVTLSRHGEDGFGIGVDLFGVLTDIVWDWL